MKVSLEDRLQDQLYGSLNNPILNGGNSELAGSCRSPWESLPAGSCSARRFLKEAPANIVEKLLYASDLDGLKTRSIDTRRPVVGFCFSRYAAVKISGFVT